MRHPALSPPKTLLPTLQKLQAFYPEQPAHFLCFALTAMANQNVIDTDECDAAMLFLETALFPDFSYMAWLSRNNKALYAETYNSDTQRRSLRQDWLNFLTQPQP